MALSDLGISARNAEKAPFVFKVRGGGASDLHVHRFRATEPLSGLFEVQLDLVSADGALDLSKLVGKPGHLRAAHSAGTRHWHGLIRQAWLMERLTQVTRYRVVLVPQLWLLSRRRDSRIFQAKSTPQILEEVFLGAEVSGDALDMRLARSYSPRDYCVQYRETDLDFAMRLMEEEGIAFYFAHDEEHHTLVLSDDPAGHDPLPEGEAVRFRAGPVSGAGAQVVYEANLSRSLPSGRATIRDFAFKAPSTDLLAQEDGADDGGGLRTDLEVYDYPGEYVEAGLGRTLARIRAEELLVDREVLEGRSIVRPLCAGFTMELLDHPSRRVKGRYLLTQVVHEGAQALSMEPRLAQGGTEYKNGFWSIPADIPFRPPRRTPRPQVPGVQTATVVGPAGEEIYTDEFARVKVQFHWDRLGKRDEQSSCWVRVSQGWGGAGWGTMHIPRIGQEVIVQFIEGDPDRPLVTGRVYNAEQGPPYALPGEATRSTWKSNSTPGGGGSNEIRFEDKAGSEEVYLHGQKDWTIAIENDKNQTIGNNESASVGNDRSRSVGNNETVDITNNETRSVGVDRSTTIGSNETLGVGANQAITVGASHTMDVAADQTETVGGSKTQTVSGDRTETISGNTTETIGASQTTTIGADLTESIGSNQTVTVGSNLTQTVGSNLTESVGSNVTRSVGSNVTETVGAMQTTSIGAAYMENVGAAKILNIGAAYMVDVGGAMMTNVGAVQSINVGAAQSVNVGGKQSINVAVNQDIDVGVNLSVSAGAKVTIKVGAATVTIEKSGDVTVKGTNLKLKGNGKISLDASGDVTVKGSKVSVKGSGPVTVKGSKVGLN